MISLFKIVVWTLFLLVLTHWFKSSEATKQVVLTCGSDEVGEKGAQGERGPVGRRGRVGRKGLLLCLSLCKKPRVNFLIILNRLSRI